jgi:hypothetical protein
MDSALGDTTWKLIQKLHDFRNTYSTYGKINMKNLSPNQIVVFLNDIIEFSPSSK